MVLLARLSVAEEIGLFFVHVFAKDWTVLRGEAELPPRAVRLPMMEKQWLLEMFEMPWYVSFSSIMWEYYLRETPFIARKSSKYDAVVLGKLSTYALVFFVLNLFLL